MCIGRVGAYAGDDDGDDQTYGDDFDDDGDFKGDGSARLCHTRATALQNNTGLCMVCAWAVVEPTASIRAWVPHRRPDSKHL